jgi:hypothetical protein
VEAPEFRLGLHDNAPGHGIVALDASRIVTTWATAEVIFEAGPHPDLDDSR